MTVQKSMQKRGCGIRSYSHFLFNVSPCKNKMMFCCTVIFLRARIFMDACYPSRISQLSEGIPFSCFVDDGKRADSFSCFVDGGKRAEHIFHF